MKIKKQKNNFIKLTNVLLIAALINIGLKANAQCSASFTYTVNPANNGEATFTNTSTIDPGLRYVWDFNDGTFDYVANPPTHVFNGIGTYRVCLSVHDTISPVDSTSGCYKTYCDTIHIINTTATCKAYFYVNSDSVNGNSIINMSSGTISNYLWDFGDGTTSTLANPGSHSYPQGGSNIICLTTSNPATLCNSTFCDTIFTSSCKSSFTYISDTANNSCNFNGSSTGTSSSYFWDFGDGTTSTLQNPNHVFTSNGSYQVCLTTSSASDSTCNNTSCQYLYMNGLCDASFYIYRTDSTNLYGFKAYVNYDKGNSTYLWDLGDGTTSTSHYPTHNYAGSGPYKLCLTVTGPNSCTDTYCDSLFAGRSSAGITFTVVVKPTVVTAIHENKMESNSSLLNYPNPFSRTTTIVYSIEKNATIELRVMDLLGQQIALVDSGNKTSGNHTIQWNAENIIPGIYLLQLKVNNEVTTKKLIISQ
jgi:PKD repeat protein